MARFTTPRASRDTRGMDRRLREIEGEYGMTPGGEREEEEGGVFGPRGFFGNIKDYYGTDSWGDWWRGLFDSRGGREERREPGYTVYPEWGRENIRELQDIMRSR